MHFVAQPLDERSLILLLQETQHIHSLDEKRLPPLLIQEVRSASAYSGSAMPNVEANRHFAVGRV